MQWLKLLAWKIRDCAEIAGSNPPLASKFQKKNVSSPLTRKDSILWGGGRNQEVACSASDHQASNSECCVWRTVPSHSSHHPQEVFLVQLSLYVHKGGLEPHSFYFPPPGNALSDWVILLHVAFCTIVAISRQKETRSRDYTLLLSNDFTGSLNTQYHRQHCTLQAVE